MNGVVFQTSAMMITAIALQRSPNQALSSSTNGSPLTKPLAGSKAKNQAKAATTVMIPYGIRTAVRTAPRPKIARCMTSARIIPITSSIATETTVMKSGVEDALPPELRLEHGGVVVEPDEAALVGEAQVDLLQREDERVDDRIRGDQQHRDHRRRAQHPAQLALGLGPIRDLLLALRGAACGAALSSSASRLGSAAPPLTADPPG